MATTCGGTLIDEHISGGDSFFSGRAAVVPPAVVERVTIEQVRFRLSWNAPQTGDIQVQVLGVDGSNLPDNGNVLKTHLEPIANLEQAEGVVDWHCIVFSPPFPVIEAGQRYAVELQNVDANAPRWHLENAANDPDAESYQWTGTWDLFATNDFKFGVYGEAALLPAVPTGPVLPMTRLFQ